MLINKLLELNKVLIHLFVAVSFRINAILTQYLQTNGQISSFQVFQLNTNNFQTNSFDSLITGAESDPEVITTKGYSTLPKAPELEPHHWMQPCVISKTNLENFLKNKSYCLNQRSSEFTGIIIEQKENSII